MKPKPIHGFSRKVHPYQILSYIFFLLLIFSYWFITFPLSKTAAKIVGGVLEGIFAIIVIVSGAMTTAIDPSDSFLVETNKAKLENKPYVAPIRDFYCNVDLAFVHESSKHCKRCNRCTEDFDHHCKWVNNDIGKKNYKAFFVLIFSVMLFLIVYLVMAIILTVNFGNDTELNDNDIFLYENKSHQIRAAMIALWIMLGISVVFLILDTNLVLFHIFLIHKGLTTFQYIVLAEERRDYKREMERARRIMGGKQRTCLDFVLCLNKPKKKAFDQTRPNADGNAPDGATVGGPGVQLSNGQAVITELHGVPGENNVMDQEGIQATHHDEIEVNNHMRNSEGMVVVNKNLEKKVGSMIEDSKAEDIKTDLVGTRSTLNTKKKSGDQEDKVKSPYSASMNEFGDVTAVNNSRNRMELHKSFHFESLKTLEDRKGDTQHVSIQIVDDVLPQNLAERDLPNPLHSAHCLDLEGKNLLKFRRHSGKEVNVERRIVASHELKSGDLWKDSKDHEETNIIKSVNKDRSFRGVEAI